MARGYNPNMFTDLSELDTDISFISSDRPSTDSRYMDPMMMDGLDPSRNSRVSVSSESSFGSMRSGPRFGEMSGISEYSTASMESVSLFTFFFLLRKTHTHASVGIIVVCSIIDNCD